MRGPLVKHIQLPFHEPVGLPTGVGVREAGPMRFAGGVTSEAADVAGDGAAGPGVTGVTTGGATGSSRRWSNWLQGWFTGLFSF